MLIVEKRNRMKCTSFSPKDASVPLDNTSNALQQLEKIYTNKIKPAELSYSFDSFHSPCLSAAEIESKPIVLLLGQYSTGKTSFIKYLLKQDYPGSHIGPEPTTDRFVAVMHGNKERVVPGNAASTQIDKPFSGLEKFGNSFLAKFQISECEAALLEKISFVDTPGVLSGEKQRIGRSYDFVNVCEWFAERADMILLMFDAYKLDISDEFKRVINILKGHDDKIRIILNKSGMISAQQLMRVYGALMWSLGKVIQTPEVIRVYIGSFWDGDCISEENKCLTLAEHNDLIKDITELPKNALIRKINNIVRRARLAKVHAYIIGYLRGEMPTMFGKSSKKASLLKQLPHIFTKVQRHYNLAVGDFPDLERFTEIVPLFDFCEFPKLHSKLLGPLQDALCKDLPLLLESLPQPAKSFKCQPKNPFIKSYLDEISINWETMWNWSEVKTAEYNIIFEQLMSLTTHGDVKLVSGKDVKEYFLESKLSQEDLSLIWKLSDLDNDGSLTLKEFCLAMHLIKLKMAGFELPSTIPHSLIPPSTISNNLVDNKSQCQSYFY